MSSSRAELLRGGALLAVGSASFRLLPFVLMVLVLAEGTPASFGAYSMALAIVAVATVAAEGGTFVTAASAGDAEALDEPALAGAGARQGIALYVAALIALAAVAQVPGYRQVLSIGAVGGLGIGLAAVTSVCTARLQRHARYGEIARSQFLGTLVGLLLGLGLYALGAGIWALVVQTAVSTLAVQMMICGSKDGRVPIRIAARLPDTTKRALRRALGATLIGAVGRRADDVFVGLLLGPAALGVYSLGYRVLTTLTEFAIYPSERVTMTQLGRARTDSVASARRIWASNQRRTFMLVAPIFLSAGLACYIIVPRVLSEQWDRAGLCAAILCAAGAAQSAYSLAYAGLFATVSPAAALSYQAWQIAILLVFTIGGASLSELWAAGGYALGSVVGGVVFAVRRSRLTRVGSR